MKKKKFDQIYNSIGCTVSIISVCWDNEGSDVMLFYMYYNVQHCFAHGEGTEMYLNAMITVVVYISMIIEWSFQ